MKLPYPTGIGNTALSLVLIVLVTGIAYCVSIFRLTPVIQYQVLFAFLFGLILTTFIGQRTCQLRKITSSIVYLLAGFIMTLVAITGWFHSPFAFTLYLLIIVQSFFFPAIVSIVQVTLLLVLVIFVPEIGSPSRDFLLVMSLLGIIPVTFYLREQYLNFKEAENSIIILKKSKKRYTDTVEELVDNHIHRFGAKLREMLTNIKLQAYKIDAAVDLSKKKQIEHEIATETSRALKLLKDFEEDTTGSRVISNPKTPGHER